MGKSDAFAAEQTMVQGGGDNSMSPYSAQSSLQCTQFRALSGLSPEGENVISSVIIQAENRAGKQEDAV